MRQEGVLSVSPAPGARRTGMVLRGSKVVLIATALVILALRPAAGVDGQVTAGGDSVWSSSAGTVFIDSVNGSVVTLRVVGAAMTETAGAATGSFTLDVSGQVNNFSRQ